MFKYLMRNVKPIYKFNADRNILINLKRMKISNSSLDVEIDRVVWIDMEMTGLDIEKDEIMEVACLITDSQMNIIAEGPDLVIKHPKSTLDTMHEWCIQQHGKTGLTQACLDSNITIESAEETLLKFIKKHISENSAPLAGNSVYMDRLFLRRYMPKIDNWLHYRIIDVSTIKELCKRFNPNLYKEIPKKDFSHRALQDIKESVLELQFYKNNFFKCS